MSNCQFVSLLWLVTISVISRAETEEGKPMEESFHKIGVHHQPTQSGEVVGTKYGYKEEKVIVYKGIPYAEPPIGELRFKKPKPVKPWKESRDATRYGAPCIQYMDFHINDKYAGENMRNQNEDCLYLNVFTPLREDTSVRYPVLVWIHGGSFLAGSGDTGIDEEASLMNIVFKKVVLVTINYRLGPLGFLSSSVDGQMGNFGLWDQIEALRWIHGNIHSFGGEKLRVTIMGESAGGASVSILAMSPMTKDLVHQAIIMSGSAAAGWSIHRGSKPNWNLKDFVAYMTCDKKIEFEFDDPVYVETNWDGVRDRETGCLTLPTSFKCSASDEPGMWECLRSQFNMTDPLQRNLIVYKLGVSKAVVDDEIIPYNVSSLLENLPRMNIMTGVAELEWGHKKGTSYGLHYSDEITEEKARRMVAEVVEDGITDALSAESLSKTTVNLISNLTYFHYLTRNSAKTSYGLTEFTNTLRRIQSDIEFVSPCHAEATAYANRNASVYLYSFEHVPAGGTIEEDLVEIDLFGQKTEVKSAKKKSIKSAYHGLDHAYIFTRGYSSNNQIDFTPEDVKLSDHLTTLLTNFIKYGDPQLERIDPRRNWPPFTAENQQYLQIKQGDFSVRDHFYWSNVTFWNQQTPLMSTFVSKEADDLTAAGKSLAEEERTQLVAYRRAWVALWILVALLALVLWIVVICIVAKRCRGTKTPQPYKNVIVSNA